MCNSTQPNRFEFCASYALLRLPMRLSDFNITDQLHTRWCRFIIQRYLGQFLEQSLTLDQLSVRLYAGELFINEVKINAHYVNELLMSMNVPLRLTDGFVGGITIGQEGVKLDNKDLGKC
ncbi:hypothetical protein DICVIV_10036 [Dictyocaulus viviparus]|uniref:Autophagy-related protein 2 n=1 Tax=Dictyocaulus viviparus TaxID=29172 RepID=A0A0D8XJM0_DICVI|nr:hypothetical protein DICVIV_10036 [Dictyocaulus viviparus]